jgi:hypothetical protein
MLPKLITNAQQYVSRDTKGLTIAEENLILCQPARGVEPRAFSLRMKCSATELYGHSHTLIKSLVRQFSIDYLTHRQGKKIQVTGSVMGHAQNQKFFPNRGLEPLFPA